MVGLMVKQKVNKTAETKVNEMAGRKVDERGCVMVETLAA